MTATWSNAVLVAVLPHFSHFSKNLNLPIPIPITTNQVAHFAPPTVLDQFAAKAVLTNGYVLFYFNGMVNGFSSPGDWYQILDIDLEGRFAGKDNMTTNEAIDLARESFVKAGHKLAEANMAEPPTEFEPPFDLARYGHIPWCKLEWRSPDSDTNVNHFYSVEFHMDMNQKRVAKMLIFGMKFWGPLPNLNPELEADYRKRMRTNAPPAVSP
jgi:hypothetical protein